MTYYINILFILHSNLSPVKWARPGWSWLGLKNDPFCFIDGPGMGRAEMGRPSLVDAYTRKNVISLILTI